MSHTKSLAGLIGQFTRLVARSIFRLQPLSKQRRSLTLNIEHKLLTHQFKNIFLKLSTDELIEVIPATELRNILKITAHCRSLMVSKPTSDNAEETTLTLTSTHITQIEKALQSMNSIFSICLLEKIDAISIRTGTISRTHTEKVKQTRHSALMSKSAIFSVGKVRSGLHAIK